jgi:hypothetical protein
MKKWTDKQQKFAVDITAWAGLGVDLILGYIGLPAYALAIAGAVVACAVTIENLIPTEG